SWAAGEWLADRPPVPDAIEVVVFRVEGEVTTDDLSPAKEAWSRPDVPLHARSFLAHRADVDAPVEAIARLGATGDPGAFAADVVGTGSSRKSAANSLLWHIGDDVPSVPNRRRGGVVLGRTIAPIFRDTLRDAGALAIECDVDRLSTGDVVVVRPRA